MPVFGGSWRTATQGMGYYPAFGPGTAKVPVLLRIQGFFTRKTWRRQAEARVVPERIFFNVRTISGSRTVSKRGISERRIVRATNFQKH